MGMEICAKCERRGFCIPKIIIITRCAMLLEVHTAWGRFNLVRARYFCIEPNNNNEKYRYIINTNSLCQLKGIIVRYKMNFKG